MEILDAEAVERDHAERTAKQKRWAFWAILVHDTTLPRGAWAVDGVIQAEPFSEAAAKAAALKAGAKKATIAVAAPHHIACAKFAGFHPPYVGHEAPSAAEATLPV